MLADRFFVRRRPIFFGILAAALYAFIFMFSGRASAAGGISSSTYPDQTNGSRVTWTLNQLCSVNEDKCMKGAQNFVAVYVPTALAGQTINMNIVDGCDTTAADTPGGTDTFGYTATTLFNVYSSYGRQAGPTVTSDDASCSGSPDLAMNFTASPTVSDVNGKYLVYMFAGTALRFSPSMPACDGLSWYVNNYRVSAVTTTVTVGFVNQSLASGGLYCSLAIWPRSCPKTQVAYSAINAYDGSETEWSEQVRFATVCGQGSTTAVNLAIYDPDDQIYQKNMTITIEEVDRVTSAHIGWVLAPGGQHITGGNDVTWYYPGGVDNPGPTFNIISTSAYIIRLTGIGDRNALQILTPGSGPAASFECDRGTGPECSINSVFKVDPATGRKDAAAKIKAGDQIGFNISYSGAIGYQVGVDGPGLGPEYSSNDIKNYLVKRSDRARAVNTIKSDGNIDVIFYSSTESDPLINVTNKMFAPNSAGNYLFNWGLKQPGGAWADMQCERAIAITPPPVLLICPAVGGARFTGQESQVPGDLALQFTNITPAGSGSIPVTRITVTVSPSIPGSPFTILPSAISGGAALAPGATAVGTLSNISFPAAGIYVINYDIDWSPGGSVPCASSIKITDHPYFKVYGGDVRTGFDFYDMAGTVCAPPNFSFMTYTIDAWGSNNGLGASKGAGTDYGVFSTGAVNGFNSAAQRRASPMSPKGLTFANSLADTWGGNFGLAGPAGCTPNYWAELADTSLTVSGGRIVDLTTPGQRKYTGDSTLSSQTVATRSTVFVTGSLYVNGNVTYTSSWASTRDIPYATIVVCGDIYIDKNVTSIAGWYIAMPYRACGGSLPGGGGIYTCASANNVLVTELLMNADCGKTLTVRGSFASKKIKFMRTHGSESRSTPNEDSSASEPAEKFIYGPESWIVNPLQPTTSASPGGAKLDAITGLPPIL